MAIWDAVGKALGQPLWRLWGGYRDRVPMIAIGGYYDSAAGDRARRSRPTASWASPAASSRSAGASPERGRRARAAAARRPPATTSCSTIDANQGYTVAAGASTCARRVAGPRHPLVRGAVPLAQRPPRHARRAHARRHPGLRRPERVLGQRLPRPDGGRRDRRLQLRRVVVGRADRVAARAPRSAHAYDVADGPPRGAAGRRAPAREPAARHLCRVLPPRPRPDLVEPRREPARRSSTARCALPTAPGSAGSSTPTTSSATGSTGSGG